MTTRIITRKILMAMLLAALAAGGWVRASATPPNRGAAEIVLEGGTSGPVAFPHLRHQEKLTDCNICHAAFPQKAGAIEDLKAQGKLAKKQVMNDQCTKCHRDKKQAGEKAGPTTCTTCHVKP
jgi:hypothetical protein